jgi:hypothetical protein
MDLAGAVTPDPVDVIVNMLDIDATHQEPESDKKETSFQAAEVRNRVAMSSSAMKTLNNP